jgi:hypothetical protein
MRRLKACEAIPPLPIRLHGVVLNYAQGQFYFYSNFEDARFLNVLFAISHTLLAEVFTTVDRDLLLQNLPRYI